MRCNFLFIGSDIFRVDMESRNVYWFENEMCSFLMSVVYVIFIGAYKQWLGLGRHTYACLG